MKKKLSVLFSWLRRLRRMGMGSLVPTERYEVVRIDFSEVDYFEVVREVIRLVTKRLPRRQASSVVKRLLGFSIHDRVAVCCVVLWYVQGYSRFEFSEAISAEALAYGREVGEEMIK